MKKYNKSTLKGFTLVEMIVVVAVFGLILAAALAIIGPVTNIFKSTSTYADSAACVDNISMYIEDNVRYANRVDICNKVLATDEANFIKTRVKEFSEKYYLYGKQDFRASQFVDDEKIYVMKINNPDPDPTSPVALDFDADTLDVSYMKSGQVSLWVYDAYTCDEITASRKEWAVNEEMYRDYSYTVTMGIYDETTDTYTISASGFCLNLNLFRNVRERGVYTHLENTNLDNVVSFSLDNVYNKGSLAGGVAGGAVEEDIYIYKNGKAAHVTGDDSDIIKWASVPRYAYSDSYPTAGAHPASNAYVTSGNDIYIFYTQCPKIENY